MQATTVHLVAHPTFSYRKKPEKMPFSRDKDSVFLLSKHENPHRTWFFRFEQQWKHLTNRTGENTTGWIQPVTVRHDNVDSPDDVCLYMCGTRLQSWPTVIRSACLGLTGWASLRVAHLASAQVVAPATGSTVRGPICGPVWYRPLRCQACPSLHMGPPVCVCSADGIVGQLIAANHSYWMF